MGRMLHKPFNFAKGRAAIKRYLNIRQPPRHRGRARNLLHKYGVLVHTGHKIGRRFYSILLRQPSRRIIRHSLKHKRTNNKQQRQCHGRNNNIYITGTSRQPTRCPHTYPFTPSLPPLYRHVIELAILGVKKRPWGFQPQYPDQGQVPGPFFASRTVAMCSTGRLHARPVFCPTFFEKSGRVWAEPTVLSFNHYLRRIL